MALVDSLRMEIAARTEREHSLLAQVRESEKRADAAAREASDLRQQLEQERANALAAAKQKGWESRKREEAAASAAAKASASAAAGAQALRDQLARQAALLKQRERELATAQAQVRSLRHNRQERHLRERQAAWLLPDARQEEQRPLGTALPAAAAAGSAVLAEPTAGGYLAAAAGGAECGGAVTVGAEEPQRRQDQEEEPSGLCESQVAPASEAADVDESAGEDILLAPLQEQFLARMLGAV